MTAEALLNAITKAMRRRLPAGVRPADLDSFVERNREELLAAIEPLAAAMEARAGNRYREVKPTSLNMWVLAREVDESPDGVIRKVSATSLPHLRRMIDAQWLVPHSRPDKKTVWWHLSDKGKEGLEQYRNSPYGKMMGPA